MQKCHICERHLAIKSFKTKSQKYPSDVLCEETYCQCDFEMVVVLQVLTPAPQHMYELETLWHNAATLLKLSLRRHEISDQRQNKIQSTGILFV